MTATPSLTRSLEIDFVRGLALLFIVVDHVDGSVLGQYTPRNFAACDAAEAFVFLSGYSAAAAYLALEARKDARAASHRFLRRGWEIYRAFIVTAVLMWTSGLVLSRLAVPPPALQATEIAAFLASPFAALTEVIFLARQPYVSDILPMYMLFMLAVPVSVTFARRSPYGFLMVSVAVWLLAPWLGKGLPSATAVDWTFNPFGWQLLFGLGLLARLRPDAVIPESTKHRHALTWASVTISVFCLILSFLWMHPEVFEAIAPTWLRDALSFDARKSTLATLRLASFLGLAWLAYVLAGQGWLYRLAISLRPIVQVGRRSLFCFVLGSVISVGVEAMTYALAQGYPAKSIAVFGDLCAVALLLIGGVVWDKAMTARRMQRIPG